MDLSDQVNFLFISIIAILTVDNDNNIDNNNNNIDNNNNNIDNNNNNNNIDRRRKELV